MPVQVSPSLRQVTLPVFTLIANEQWVIANVHYAMTSLSLQWGLDSKHSVQTECTVQVYQSMVDG